MDTHLAESHGLTFGDATRQQALSLFEEVLELRRSVLPSNHPDLTVTLVNLGSLYRLTGDYTSALPLYQVRSTPTLQPTHKAATPFSHCNPHRTPPNSLENI